MVPDRQGYILPMVVVGSGQDLKKDICILIHEPLGTENVPKVKADPSILLCTGMIL